MWKRSFDIVVSGCALVVLLPLLCVVWILVRTTSRGPGIYRQQRIGKDGVPFTILKFRTLTIDADQSGTRYSHFEPVTMPTTPPGKALRRTHIDELPQLINVLLGDMSLVGPRPLTAETHALISGDVPAYETRLSVRPGLTGLAQVRSSVRLRRNMRKYLFACDQVYIRKSSLWLDLYILMCTVPEVTRGRGV